MEMQEADWKKMKNNSFGLSSQLEKPIQIQVSESLIETRNNCQTNAQRAIFALDLASLALSDSSPTTIIRNFTRQRRTSFSSEATTLHPNTPVQFFKIGTQDTYFPTNDEQMIDDNPFPLQYD